MRILVAFSILFFSGCAHRCITNGNCPPGDICVKGKCCDVYGRVK